MKKSVESRSHLGSIVIPTQQVTDGADCAEKCAETAGCTRFNVYETSCELLLPSYLYKSTPPPSDWVESGVLSPNCGPFPWADDMALVTEILCEFRAPGWTTESLLAAFLAENGVDATTPIGHWKTDGSWNWSTSQIITAEVTIPNSNSPNLVLTRFEITTWSRREIEDRRRRDTSISDDFLSLDAEIRGLLQSQLKMPNGVEFIQTTSISSKTKITRNGAEVAECQPTYSRAIREAGPTTTTSTTTSTTSYTFQSTTSFPATPAQSCTCINGATESPTGECEIHSCDKSTVDGSINDTINAVKISVDNDADLGRRRTRQAG